MPVKKLATITGSKVIRWSSDHAITLTLNPKLFHLDPVIQRNIIQGKLNELNINGSIKGTFWCELTQNQNIHVHGFIRVPINGTKTVPYIFASIVRADKDIGHWCIKQIEDWNGWKTYCTKEADITKQNTGEHSLLCDFLDYADFNVAQT